jgi:hypothetical protein
MINFEVQVASLDHTKYAEQICYEMEQSAKARGTGIAKRSPEYLIKKMEEGKAIIALGENGTWVGFCYIETWQHGQYVANSGLIVHPDFRKSGAAKAIKAKAFELSRTKYPEAKIIGITTSLAVMKINSELGYEPTTFSELTVDEAFWKGCQSCVNYDVLSRTDRKHCLCTGMIYKPEWEQKRLEKEKNSQSDKRDEAEEHEHWDFQKDIKIVERLKQIKEKIYLKIGLALNLG